jgi:hypothetical protein
LSLDCRGTPASRATPAVEEAKNIAKRKKCAREDSNLHGFLH